MRTDPFYTRTTRESCPFGRRGTITVHRRESGGSDEDCSFASDDSTDCTGRWEYAFCPGNMHGHNTYCTDYDCSTRIPRDRR